MTGTMKAQQRAQASPEFPGSREQALVRESRKGLMPGRPGSTERRPTTPSTWQVLTEYFEWINSSCPPEAYALVGEQSYHTQSVKSRAAKRQFLREQPANCILSSLLAAKPKASYEALWHLRDFEETTKNNIILSSQQTLKTFSLFHFVCLLINMVIFFLQVFSVLVTSTGRMKPILHKCINLVAVSKI